MILEKLIEQNILPPRWWSPKQIAYTHPVINGFFNNKHRWTIACAGRRAYKSEAVRRRIILDAISKPNQRILVGAPTFRQVKSIYWNPLKELLPSFLKTKINESELSIHIQDNNSTIELFSLDAVHRIDGGAPVTFLCADECQQIPDLEYIIGNKFIPLLMDAHGSLMLVGTAELPEGNFWKEYVESKELDPDWKVFRWSSDLVLDKIELESAKANCDIRTYDCQYMNVFPNIQGDLAYYNFDTNLHVKDIPFNPLLPLCISADFNVQIMNFECSQILKDDFLNVFHEITQTSTNIYKMMPYVKEFLHKLLGDKDKTHPILWFGDFAGNARNASSMSSCWQEIKDHMAGYNIQIRVPSSPPITSRVSAFNSKLRTADNKVHMCINPKCVELIKDMRTVYLEMLTGNKGSVGTLTHSSDAQGYMIHTMWPIRKGEMYNLQ